MFIYFFVFLFYLNSYCIFALYYDVMYAFNPFRAKLQINKDEVIKFSDTNRLYDVKSQAPDFSQTRKSLCFCRVGSLQDINFLPEKLDYTKAVIKKKMIMQ